MSEAIHLKSIKIQGYKAIRSFEIEPNGKSIRLSGRNRAGKSSTIEAIYVALTQKEIPGVPVHREAVKARIELGLTNDFVVTWTCTEGGTKSLKIEDADGRPFPKPAEFLRKLIGDISFDPFEFSELTPADQKRRLEKILGLDFSDIDLDKRKALDRKAAADRAKKAAEDDLDRLASVTETAAVDTADLMAKRQQLDALRDRRVRYTDRVQTLQQGERLLTESLNDAKEELETLRARALELVQKEIPSLDKDLEERRTAIATGADALKALDEEISAFPDVDDALRRSGEINAAAAQWERKVHLRKTYSDAEMEIESANLALAEIEKNRIERIAAAQLPIEGLAFSEDGLTFEGLPFDERSQSKSTIIKVGCAIAISQNSNLRLCKIKDGSLLDRESKEQILALLSEHGFQTLIEEVSQDGSDLCAEIIETPEEG